MCIRHLRSLATCRQVRPLFQKGINALWSLDTAGSAPPSFGGFAKRQWFCPFVIGDTASKCVSMGVDVRHVVEVSGISWVKLRRIPGNTCESYLIGSSLFRSGLEHLDVVSGAPDAGAKTPGSYPGFFKCHAKPPPTGQELPGPVRDFLGTIRSKSSRIQPGTFYLPSVVHEIPGPQRKFVNAILCQSTRVNPGASIFGKVRLRGS